MLQYFKDIWLGVYTALVGMRITLDHMFRKNVTVQYPDARLPIPENARNRLLLDYDMCNGCNSCARACPVNCIEIETVKGTPEDMPPPLKNGKKRALWVTKYDIDFAKCCFCALCVDACPTEAILTTKEFEYSSYDRDELIYSFSPMTPEQAKEKSINLKKAMAEKKKAAAAKKKAEAAKAAEKETKKPAAKPAKKDDADK